MFGQTIICRSLNLLNHAYSVNVMSTRHIAKLGREAILPLRRYRLRRGLPPVHNSPGTDITDGPEWCYPDGTPGEMNKAQSDRYVRDQDFGRTMLKHSWIYNKSKVSK